MYMYIYYIYIYKYVHIYIYLYIYTCIPPRSHRKRHVCTSSDPYTHTYVNEYIQHTCTYIHTLYANEYIQNSWRYIHTYTHTNIQLTYTHTYKHMSRQDCIPGAVCVPHDTHTHIRTKIHIQHTYAYIYKLIPTQIYDSRIHINVNICTANTASRAPCVYPIKSISTSRLSCVCVCRWYAVYVSVSVCMCKYLCVCASVYTIRSTSTSSSSCICVCRWRDVMCWAVSVCACAVVFVQ